VKNKYLFGGGIIAVFFVAMIYLFTQTSIQYENDYSKIISSEKTVKAAGVWVKEKSFEYDKMNKTFSFFMEDKNGKLMKVVYSGIMPNNFESSTSVVVTGKYYGGVFHAKDILTKCPSKYQEHTIPKAGA
jgi:cytochrome c-type biogenesis protein CcmE